MGLTLIPLLLPFDTFVFIMSGVASRPLTKVNLGNFFGFSFEGPADERYPFTKSSKTDLG